MEINRIVLRDDDYFRSEDIRHGNRKLSDILDDKSVDLLFSDGVSTDTVHELLNNKKFSNYKFLEFTLYNGSGANSRIIATATFMDGTVQEISKYESYTTAWATPIIVWIQYQSDTTFRCIKAAYISNGNYQDNPYTIVIKGIK